jgi:hypothetical protein
LPSRSLVKAICVPSGENTGSVSVAAFMVRLTGFVPSAFITQMSSLPERPLWNTIRVPSGDQSGLRSAAAFVVSRVGVAEPVTGMV